jgi:hypothetical protein
MVEVTTKRCFVLWTSDKRGNVRHDPTVYTSAHACIEAGERQKDKTQIEDYNYSVVMQPQIGGDMPKIKFLTSNPRADTISL